MKFQWIEGNDWLDNRPEGTKAVLLDTAEGLKLLTEQNQNGGFCDCCSGPEVFDSVRFVFLNEEQLAEMISSYVGSGGEK